MARRRKGKRNFFHPKYNCVLPCACAIALNLILYFTISAKATSKYVVSAGLPVSS
jgi:hypothetical protein